MKQSKKVWCGLLAGVLCLSLCACGASAGSTKGADMEMQYFSADSAAPMEPGAVFDGGVREEAELKSVLTNGAGNSVYRDEAVKLIRRANLTVQTTEFDKAVTALEELVIRLGGYYENAEIRSGSF